MALWRSPQRPTGSGPLRAGCLHRKKKRKGEKGKKEKRKERKREDKEEKIIGEEGKKKRRRLTGRPGSTSL